MPPQWQQAGVPTRRAYAHWRLVAAVRRHTAIAKALRYNGNTGSVMKNFFTHSHPIPKSAARRIVPMDSAGLRSCAWRLPDD